MIRPLIAFFAMALAACSPASSVVSNTVFTQPVADPAAHGDELAERIARDGMPAIREVFGRIGQTNAQVEQTIAALDDAIADRPARSWQKVEDVTLSNTVRKIYYFHGFDGTLLYTRLDFVREGDTWYFVGLYFANNWEMVASPTTPGFQSSIAPSSTAAAQP